MNRQAGEFNSKVRIEYLKPAVNTTTGAKASTWTFFADWWCRIAPITGSESYGNQAIEAKAQYKMDGGFLAGVTARMRVNDVDAGVIYDITSPPLDWDNRHVYMTLLAKSGVNQG